MAGLGAVDGSCFPGDWGLATLAFTLVAASAVLIADLPRPARLELAFLGGLAALALWTLLSTAWSPGATAQVLEAERGTLYVAAAAAAILLLSFREAFAAILGGILAGAVAVALYALGTRLFPGDVGGAYDPSSGYRLAEPLGYWNALGILDRAGNPARRRPSRLTVADSRRGCSRRRRSSSCCRRSTSRSRRGALLALVLGAMVQIAADARRARLLGDRARGRHAGAPSCLSGLPATTRSPQLATRSRPPSTRAVNWRKPSSCSQSSPGAGAVAVHDRRAAGAVPCRRRPTAVGRLGSQRWRFPSSSGCLSWPAARSTSPSARPTPSGSRRRPRPERAPQRRLLSASGNGRSDYWRVARTMVHDEPLLGTGAGSFEAHWFRERSVAFPARDAHNLYLETLAELGPVGLALLLASLTLPLLALPAVRGFAYAPAAVGAYVAYLVHAGVDWVLGGSRRHRAGDLLRRCPARPYAADERRRG